MSETESIVEDTEYIAVDASDYVVLAEGEELEQCEDGSVIYLADGQELVETAEVVEDNDEDGTMMITEDGQMMMVEEVHEVMDEESGEQLEVYQHEEVTEEPPTPQQLWAELEKKRKRLNLPRVPRKFMLFDGICAEIVDYDDEDSSPIVEFSMVADDREAERLPVECGVCPDIMHKSKLDAHLKTHLKPGSKRYKCIYCEDDFVTRAYAAGHARRHMGIRPYVCVPCKMYYCTKQDLKVHEQRRHLAKEHICEQCGKTFAQNTSLRHHRLLVHEQQRNYECEHCGKKFLRKYAMTEHIRNVHYGDRRLLDCPFCDLRFKDTHKLAQHRKDMHLSQGKFECRVCGLEFNHIDFFDAHRRSLQCRKKLGRHLYQERQDSFDEIETIRQEDHDDTQMMSDQIQHFQYDVQLDQNNIYHQQQDVEEEQEITEHQYKQEQLEQQEVVVEELTHDMHAELVNEHDLEEDLEDQENIEVDEHEKVKAEQQLLYEIAAMDNA